ncbi:hypothetical protein OIV83_002930 [Microbotryomycetes sp. JL201]|nr:hypothetical protein OIV83_002930 [Microbotryomycetes sp. JL201]
MSTSQRDQKSLAAVREPASAPEDHGAERGQASSSDAMLSVAPPPYTEPLLPSNERTVTYNTYGATQSNYPRGPSLLPVNPSAYASHQHMYNQPNHTLFDERVSREADRRARRRFCGALLWAFVIWTVVGVMAGGVSAVAINQGRQQNRHRHHASTSPVTAI